MSGLCLLLLLSHPFLNPTRMHFGLTSPHHFLSSVVITSSCFFLSCFFLFCFFLLRSLLLHLTNVSHRSKYQPPYLHQGAYQFQFQFPSPPLAHSLPREISFFDITSIALPTLLTFLSFVEFTLLSSCASQTRLSLDSDACDSYSKSLVLATQPGIIPLEASLTSWRRLLSGFFISQFESKRDSPRWRIILEARTLELSFHFPAISAATSQELKMISVAKPDPAEVTSHQLWQSISQQRWSYSRDCLRDLFNCCVETTLQLADQRYQVSLRSQCPTPAASEIEVACWLDSVAKELLRQEAFKEAYHISSPSGPSEFQEFLARCFQSGAGEFQATPSESWFYSEADSQGDSVTAGITRSTCQRENVLHAARSHRQPVVDQATRGSRECYFVDTDSHSNRQCS